MNPPVVSIVSKKKSGKTTLIEKLIPELKAQGYRVGTIKHDTHGFSIDHEGKDTWRHKEAGASTVVITCPWKISLVKDLDEEATLDQVVQDYFDDVDLVITEGFKKAGKPQIEVFLSTSHSSPLHGHGEQGPLVALVSNEPLDLGVPCFNIDDVQGITEFIITSFLKSR